MEINLPPVREVKVEIAESNLLTLRMNEKGELFWNFGIESLKPLEREGLRAFLKQHVIDNPKLVALLKIDRAAKYNQMVEMIDEFNLSNVTRFSLAPLTEADMKLMAKASS